ncbi:DUF397 domain-containing protein [Streptomyces alboflavus]|uniref:DUF397 domain-containing protein n=1 Tax=Streptomyces alboflavus TaxID=67267 RepID=UPI0037A2B379
MYTEQPAQVDWFKSNYSGDEGGECVEVAAALTAIHVRDSNSGPAARVRTCRLGRVRRRTRAEPAQLTGSTREFAVQLSWRGPWPGGGSSTVWYARPVSRASAMRS